MGGAGLWLGSWAGFLTGRRLAPFVPSPPHVAQRLLRLAGAGAGDVVLDLGCGDGRLLLEACGPRFGCRRGDGYELNPELAAEARRAVAAAGLDDRVRIHEACAKGAEISGCSVVLLYLSERGNAELLPRLQRDLRPGSRVATFAFPIPGCRPSSISRVDGIDLFLYDLTALRAAA